MQLHLLASLTVLRESMARLDYFDFRFHDEAVDYMITCAGDETPLAAAQVSSGAANLLGVGYYFSRFFWFIFPIFFGF